MATLRDGTQVLVRALRKQDLELERRFIEALSPQSRRYRFLCAVGTANEALLKKLTDLDAQRDAALIAVVDDGGTAREIGIARFCGADLGKAEVAVTVADDWQHKGLGTLLLTRLIDVAKQHGVHELYSFDSASNQPMRQFAADMGFQRRTDPEDATQVIYTLSLAESQSAEQRQSV